MSSETCRVSIGRYHDGAAKTNWGGRATSLALAGLIHAQEHLALSRPVNGTYIVREFEDSPARMVQGPRNGRRPKAACEIPEFGSARVRQLVAVKRMHANSIHVVDYFSLLRVSLQKVGSRDAHPFDQTVTLEESLKSMTLVSRIFGRE